MNDTKPCIDCIGGGICCYSGEICDYIGRWDEAQTNCDGYDNGDER